MNESNNILEYSLILNSSSHEMGNLTCILTPHFLIFLKV
jgi:hypothetical protein